MTTVNASTATPSESVLTDILLRIYVAGAILFFAASAFFHWRADPARVTLLMIAVIESITAGIIICSRRAQRRDWRPLSVVASFVSMFFMLALNLAPGDHVIPEALGVGLQIIGMLVQLYAKLSLGRSFGVLPATRQLVTRGAYRWLRHPIYFGYLIAHIGFLLANFSLQNCAVFVVLYIAQILRIGREEQMLCSLPGYSGYRDRVRYRLIPLLY
jgi:protein-S-isoprenylcysteine O-methyltransferase Ste14